MTNEAPTLNHLEWQAVSAALEDAAQCGCREVPEPGSLKGRLLRLFPGMASARLPEDRRFAAIRNFVCATHRQRRRADEYVPELLEQGFSRAQIEALALLSA